MNLKTDGVVEFSSDGHRDTIGLGLQAASRMRASREGTWRGAGVEPQTIGKVKGADIVVGGPGSMQGCTSSMSSCSLPWQRRLFRRATKIQRKLVREEGEKHSGLTRRTSACLGKPKGVRTGRISLAT
jgi:hypothetical protein